MTSNTHPETLSGIQYDKNVTSSAVTTDVKMQLPGIQLERSPFVTEYYHSQRSDHAATLGFHFL